LSQDELYNTTLEYYLRQDISPEVAVKLFRLIETKFIFSEEDEFELVRKNAQYIKDEHWRIIIKQRYPTYASRLRCWE